MTPAEHYARAEFLLVMAVGDFPATPIASDIAAVAQVHATLATVDPDGLRRMRKSGTTSITDPSVTDRPVDPE